LALATFTARSWTFCDGVRFGVPFARPPRRSPGCAPRGMACGYSFWRVYFLVGCPVAGAKVALGFWPEHVNTPTLKLFSGRSLLIAPSSNGFRTFQDRLVRISRGHIRAAHEACAVLLPCTHRERSVRIWCVFPRSRHVPFCTILPPAISTAIAKTSMAQDFSWCCR
jgi:hypothetical protein